MADNDEPLKPAATSATPSDDAPEIEFDAAEGDIDFVPAEPLKQAAGAAAPAADAPGWAGTAQTLKDGAAKLTTQATDKARAYAEDGKARATTAIDDFAKMVGDAAGQVEERLGPQFGQYAHQASGAVSGFADSFRDKDVDQLFDDARGFVRKSPAMAIGVAAVVGFALARLVKSGLDATDRDRS